MDVFLFFVIKGVLMIAEKINGIRPVAEGEGSREVNFPLYGLIPCYCLHQYDNLLDSLPLIKFGY
jgi:hypothetical protein